MIYWILVAEVNGSPVYLTARNPNSNVLEYAHDKRQAMRFGSEDAALAFLSDGPELEMTPPDFVAKPQR